MIQRCNPPKEGEGVAGLQPGPGTAWTKTVSVGERKGTREEEVEDTGSDKETCGAHCGPPGMPHTFFWLPFSPPPLCLIKCEAQGISPRRKGTIFPFMPGILLLMMRMGRLHRNRIGCPSHPQCLPHDHNEEGEKHKQGGANSLQGPKPSEPRFSGRLRQGFRFRLPWG